MNMAGTEVSSAEDGTLRRKETDTLPHLRGGAFFSFCDNVSKGEMIGLRIYHFCTEFLLSVFSGSNPVVPIGSRKMTRTLHSLFIFHSERQILYKLHRKRFPCNMIF